MKNWITCTLPAALTRWTLMTPRGTTKKPSHGSPSRKRYSPFSRFLSVENELISAIPAEGRPAKTRERSNEFAMTK